MSDAPTKETQASSAFGWGCLAVVFVLACLLAVSREAFAAALGILVIGGGLFAITLGRVEEAKRFKREWYLSGPSPLRQEVTLVAPHKCTVGFHFVGNQSLDYRYDVLDAHGDEVPMLRSHPVHPPGSPYWIHDDGGPGGFIYTPARPDGITLTLRYSLVATDAKSVRNTKLSISVERPGIKVRLPDQPTTLPEPVVRWGRLSDPPERLATVPAPAVARDNA